MEYLKQIPRPQGYLLRFRGDKLTVTLKVEGSPKGRAVLRTNIGSAGILRQETIEKTERGIVPMEKAWHDLPLKELSPGFFQGEFKLDEVGVYSGKTCFFPENSNEPQWPEGDNFKVKVVSSSTVKNNSIYSVFPRQFGSFREVKRKLDFIMGEMGFNIIQTFLIVPKIGPRIAVAMVETAVFAALAR